MLSPHKRQLCADLLGAKSATFSALNNFILGPPAKEIGRAAYDWLPFRASDPGSTVGKNRNLSWWSLSSQARSAGRRGRRCRRQGHWRAVRVVLTDRPAVLAATASSCGRLVFLVHANASRSLSVFLIFITVFSL